MTKPHHHEPELDTQMIRAAKGIRHQWRKSVAGGKKHFVSLTYTTAMTGLLAIGTALVNHYERLEKTETVGVAAKGPTWADVHADEAQITELKTKVANNPTWSVIRADESDLAALKTKVACLQQQIEDWQPAQPTKGHR